MVSKSTIVRVFSSFFLENSSSSNIINVVDFFTRLQYDLTMTKDCLFLDVFTDLVHLFNLKDLLQLWWKLDQLFLVSKSYFRAGSLQPKYLLINFTRYSLVLLFLNLTLFSHCRNIIWLMCKQIEFSSSLLNCFGNLGESILNFRYHKLISESNVRLNLIINKIDKIFVIDGILDQR